MSFLPPQLAPTLEAAFRDVRARTPEARAAALEVLSAVGDADRERAIEAVRSLVSDPAGVVRVAALVALGRLKDEGASALVLARLEDEDPTVREVALICATELGGEGALDAVLRALDSPRPEMRFQAVAAIGELVPERARGHLVRRLEDSDAKVRAHAASALAALGDGPGARHAIGALLEDPDAMVRADAAVALATIGDPRAIPQLRVLLQGDAERAISAAELLGDLGAKDAREDLARISRSFLKPLMVKAAASATLARFEDPRGLEGLHSVLGAWRADGRTYAITAIGEIGIAALAPELAALAERPRGADPVAIAEALAKLANVSELAKTALARMAGAGGEAGARARELIAERP